MTRIYITDCQQQQTENNVQFGKDALKEMKYNFMKLLPISWLTVIYRILYSFRKSKVFTETKLYRSSVEKNHIHLERRILYELH